MSAAATPEVHAGQNTFVRHTDTEGRATVHCYRTWNRDVLLRSLADAAEVDNAKAIKDKKPAKAKVESISEAQYKAEK